MIGRAMTIGALVLGVGVSTAAAQPSVPPGLEVPAGNEVYLEGYAVGTQNYICLSGPAGKRWQFLGPQATLFFTLQGSPPQQITTHFLSANPVEAGTARPTWQHSFDSSRVWGRALASSTDPNYVQPGAIPWLLVQTTGTALGPAGGAALAETTFIHRVNTSGGVAPSTGCSAPSHEGVVALMPYTTDYVFYRASQ